jgi:hypothetical protein
MKALDAGKHILCEKPMASNEQEAKQMADKVCTRRLLHNDGIWVLIVYYIRLRRSTKCWWKRSITNITQQCSTSRIWLIRDTSVSRDMITWWASISNIDTCHFGVESVITSKPANLIFVPSIVGSDLYLREISQVRWSLSVPRWSCRCGSTNLSLDLTIFDSITILLVRLSIHNKYYILINFIKFVQSVGGITMDGGCYTINVMR